MASARINPDLVYLNILVLKNIEKCFTLYTGKSSYVYHLNSFKWRNNRDISGQNSRIITIVSLRNTTIRVIIKLCGSYNIIFLQLCATDINFPSKALFSDESKFTLHISVNKQICDIGRLEIQGKRAAQFTDQKKNNVGLCAGVY